MANRRQIRRAMTEATVAAVYRHACSDAAAAASAQDWAECHRLLAMSREIARAYPSVSTWARFAREKV